MRTLNRILPLPFLCQPKRRWDIFQERLRLRVSMAGKWDLEHWRQWGQVEQRQEPGWPDLGAVWREPQRWPCIYTDLWNLVEVTLWQQGAGSWAHVWALPRGQRTTRMVAWMTRQWAQVPLSPRHTTGQPQKQSLLPDQHWSQTRHWARLSPTKLPAHRRSTSQINSNRFKALNCLLYFILFRYFLFAVLRLHCCAGFL